MTDTDAIPRPPLRDIVKILRILHPDAFPLTEDSFEPVANASLRKKHWCIKQYHDSTLCGQAHPLDHESLFRKYHGAFSMEEFPQCKLCDRSKGALIKGHSE